MQRTSWIILAVVILLIIGGWLWLQRAPAAPTIQGPSGPPSVTGPSEQPPSIPTREITIAGNEFRFEPKEIRVQRGEEVTLTFKNTGRAPHTFTIPELNLDTGIVPSGSEFRLTFIVPDTNLTYQSLCTVPGHKEAGMVGTLVVQ